MMQLPLGLTVPMVTRRSPRPSPKSAHGQMPQAHREGQAAGREHGEGPGPPVGLPGTQRAALGLLPKDLVILEQP